MSELKIHNMTTIGYLSRTEYLLRNVGWCKGTEYERNDDGNVRAYCLSGALNVATRDANCVIGPVIGAVLNSLAPGNDFVSYNDGVNTTFDDIINLIHRAEAVFLAGGPKTPPDGDESEVGETDDDSQIETDPDDSEESSDDDDDDADIYDKPSDQSHDDTREEVEILQTRILETV